MPFEEKEQFCSNSIYRILYKKDHVFVCTRKEYKELRQQLTVSTKTKALRSAIPYRANAEWLQFCKK